MSGKQRSSSSSRSKPKTVPAPHFDACTFLEETISPLFDPNRVLLRRVFFINQEKTRYVSVGFYPAQNYQPLVEFGGSRIKPITLNEKQVSTLAVHLPRLYQELCNSGGFHVKVDEDFAISTTASNNVARFTMSGQRIQLKIAELRYLKDMFYIVQNQLTHYISALPDLMTYVTQVIGSTEFVNPGINMSPNISYYQLYEELKAVV
jgi:hypothetical protein